MNVALLLQVLYPDALVAGLLDVAVDDSLVCVHVCVAGDLVWRARAERDGAIAGDGVDVVLLQQRVEVRRQRRQAQAGQQLEQRVRRQRRRTAQQHLVHFILFDRQLGRLELDGHFGPQASKFSQRIETQRSTSDKR